MLALRRKFGESILFNFDGSSVELQIIEKHTDEIVRVKVIFRTLATQEYIGDVEISAEYLKTFIICEDIMVTITEIGPRAVRVGIQAPKRIEVLRAELLKPIEPRLLAE